MAKRTPKSGECCPILDLVLSRTNAQAKRQSLSREAWFSPDGRSGTALVLTFPKAPRGDKSEFANATYAPVEFCPFCGKKQPNERVKKERATRAPGGSDGK
jgi:hypothetical protein